MYNKLPDVHPGIYRHYTGSLFQVMCIAKHAYTDDLFVVYRSVSVDSGPIILPLHEFTESVSYHGEIVPRFRRHADTI